MAKKVSLLIVVSLFGNVLLFYMWAQTNNRIDELEKAMIQRDIELAEHDIDLIHQIEVQHSLVTNIVKGIEGEW